jgi:hypothetical protein
MASYVRAPPDKTNGLGAMDVVDVESQFHMLDNYVPLMGINIYSANLEHL